MRHRSRFCRIAPWLVVGAWPVAAGVVIAGAQSAPATTAQTRCRIDGRITSGTTPLPGVSLVARADTHAVVATSTGVDGQFVLVLEPAASYRVSVELTGFTSVERDIVATAPPCSQTLDVQLTLAARTASAAAARATDAPTPTTGRGGRGFQPLNVQGETAAAAVAETAAAPDGADDLARLLPTGFAVETAQADAVAITGSGGATNLDRAGLSDRLQAIALGQLDPAAAPPAQTPGPQAGGGRAGRGGAPGAAGGRGIGGPGGGFLLGGRGARGQNPYQGSATYTFGGSALNSSPYQLRPEVSTSQPQYTQNSFGATLGGPLKIPGIYADTNRRTNVQINFTGSRNSNLFDQYATVPTGAMRSGDFSSSPTALIDPTSGQPFAGNQIPTARIDPVARSLLQFIPAPNLPGVANNFHVSTTGTTSSEALSVRLTQNLSRTVQAGGRGPAGRGGFGGGGFGGAGRGGGGAGRGAGGRGTNVQLSAQLQYRHNDTQALNVFPGLGGQTSTTTVSAPIALNVSRGRSVQTFSVNLTHAGNTTTNAFTNVNNVAGDAGIQYPAGASTDPSNFGLPNISFSGFTGIRGTGASSRTDDRLMASYTWMHPIGRQQLRIGGDYRLDRSTASINGNARGSFTFSGLYTSGGATVLGPTGADFADFLLGMPQQASLQVGGTSHLRQHSIDLFVEDNWQKTSKLTLNLGLRYELAMPYVETSGRMANLDAASDLTAVSAVLPGTVGPFTGAFPAGLLNVDKNNVGPRLGFAYRLAPRTILRGGYSITYNSGSYASIARELVGQPPFADTETITGSEAAPLTLAEALLSSSSSTTNNWGVSRDYALGMIQTWNATLTKNLTQNWVVTAGYTGIKGTDLDILRAPDLGAGGLLLPGTQPFIWESSGGRSLMNGGTFQLQRRLAGGVSGNVSYTLARSMDNASTLGAGGPVVAQNDRDLAAEYAPSNFDRRQQLAGQLYVELPWGPNRRWLKNGGVLANLFGEWSAQFTLTLQSGTPLTARVLGAASDLLRGVNGSLRANYDGAPIQLPDPTVTEFFNTTAFTTPPPGQFGDSTRNMIVGPGARQLNALFQRDLRLGGTRAFTLQVNANNLLNTVQWAAVDTNVNSPTFGQVVSAKPMRTVTIAARFRF